MLYFDAPARPTIAVTTVAEARAAGPSSLFVAGMLLRIQGVNFLDFDPTSMAADNGTTVLKPDDIPGGSPGRWVSAASGAQGAQGGSGAQGAQGSIGVQGAQGTGSTLLVNRINDGNVGGAKLVDIVTTGLIDGSVANVYSVGALFVLVKAPSAALLAAVDGITVVASTATAGSVWVRLTNVSNPRFAANPPTEIDPGAGSDDNDGLTFATAIKTADEWSRRMNAVTVKASITVNCAAGDVGSFFGKQYYDGAAACLIRIVGAKSLSSTMTVSAIVAENSAPGVQQEYWLTKTGGPTLAGDERLRILTSAVTNNVGATACVRGFEGSNAAHPYTSTWSNGEVTVNNLFAAVGDTFAVETLLTTFRADDLDTRNIGQGVGLSFVDMIHPATTSVPGISPSSNNARVTPFGDHLMIGCIFGTTGGSIVRIDTDQLWFRGCEFKTQTHFVGGGPTGINASQCTFRAGAVINPSFTQVGCVFEGATSSAQFWSNGSDALFSRITGQAYTISGGSFATNNSRVWTPLAGARSAVTVGIDMPNADTTLSTGLFATISDSIAASVAAVRMVGQVVTDFTTNLTTRSSVVSTSTALGSLGYLHQVTGNPATAPVAGVYLYPVGTELRYMDTAGTVHVFGAQGAQGSQGSAGAQGSQGASGSGSQGAQGSQGSAGAQGAQGVPGPLMGPIQYDYWVGSLATPPAVPSGEIEAPFATLDDALAVTKLLPASSYITIHLTYLDNTASTADFTTDPTVPGDKSYRVISEIGGSALGGISGDTTDGGFTLILDDIAASGITPSGSGTADIVARGRGLALGDISATCIASIYLDHVACARINSPNSSLDAYSSTITGHVDLDRIGRIDDCSFGESAEDIRHFNVASTSDPSRQNFTRCQFHSGYAYTDSGGSTFASDDFTMNQLIVAFGGFATGTTWIHLDARSTVYNPVLGSINNDADIADGTMAGSYRMDGDFLAMRIIIQQGASTTFGTGNSTFTMPDSWVIVAPQDGIPTAAATLTCSSNAIGGSYVMPCSLNPGGLLEFGVNLASFAFDAGTDIAIELNVPVAPATA